MFMWQKRKFNGLFKMVISEKERKKVAIAIGRSPDFFAPNYNIPMFDPANDARHDYSILVKVRPVDSHNSKPNMGPKHVLWRDFMVELRLLQLNRGMSSSTIHEGYILGDYARAYLNATEDHG